MDKDEERREAKWAAAMGALTCYFDAPTANSVTVLGPSWDHDFATGLWIEAISETDPYWQAHGDTPDATTLVDLLRNISLALEGEGLRHLINLFKRNQFKAKVSPRNRENIRRAKVAYDEALEICTGQSVSSNGRTILADHLETFVIAKRSTGSEVPSYERTSPHEARHAEAMDHYRALRALRAGVSSGQEVEFLGQRADLHDPDAVVKVGAAVEGLVADSLQNRIDGKNHSSRRFKVGKRGRQLRGRADL